MNDDEEKWEFEGEPLNNIFDIFSDEMYPDQIYPKKCSNTEIAKINSAFHAIDAKVAKISSAIYNSFVT